MDCLESRGLVRTCLLYLFYSSAGLYWYMYRLTPTFLFVIETASLTPRSCQPYTSKLLVLHLEIVSLTPRARDLPKTEKTKNEHSRNDTDDSLVGQSV